MSISRNHLDGLLGLAFSGADQYVGVTVRSFSVSSGTNSDVATATASVAGSGPFAFSTIHQTLLVSSVDNATSSIRATLVNSAEVVGPFTLYVLGYARSSLLVSYVLTSQSVAHSLQFDGISSVNTMLGIISITPLHFGDTISYNASGAFTGSTYYLVDTGFYDSRYHDVAASVADPQAHYDNFGWREGRDPNAFFSTVAYRAWNTDVRDAGANPLTQYDQYGWKEGRDPSANFDTRLYLLHNPDVARAGVDPLVHYLHFGQGEGRQTYAAVGPIGDVIGGFDDEFYILSNLDIANYFLGNPSFAPSGLKAFEHFFDTGWKEGRNPDAFFDTRYYLAHNPDVAAAGVNPLVHYDQNGWREGRNPSAAFNTSAYLAHSPDVRAAGLNPLEHYLQFGIYEGRAIT